MKAMLFSEHGGPEVLRYADVPTPEPGPGEVLVKVGAVTVNFGPDTMSRSGVFRFHVDFPHVPGSDPAGSVVAVGSAEDEHWIGRRVVAPSLIPDRSCRNCLAGRGENYCEHWKLLGVHCWGGRAEFVTLPAYNLVPVPDALSDVQAAALAMSYHTAHHGIVTLGRIGPTDTLLVTAAGSGIGAAAIQLAKHAGARVIATSSRDWKCERAVDLGADAAVNSRDPEWSRKVTDLTDGHGVTAVFDNVGPASWAQTVGLLARGGRFICSGATSGHELTLDVMALYRDQITMHFYANGARTDLLSVVQLAAGGQLTPVIDKVFALSESVAAETYVTGCEQFGKVALVPDSVFAGRSDGGGAHSVPRPTTLGIKE